MKTNIYGVYKEGTDMTFIIEETIKEIETEEFCGEIYVSTEVKGFYYGEPNEEDNKTFYGKLKAEY